MTSIIHKVFRSLSRGLLVVLALAATASALAHHSAARFDFSKNVEVKGVIKHLAVENPHIELVLEIDDPDGGSKEVQFEGHSRNNVFRKGWRPDSMKVGDEVTIFVAPMRNGEDGGYIQSWKLEDGTEF